MEEEGSRFRAHQRHVLVAYVLFCSSGMFSLRMCCSVCKYAELGSSSWLALHDACLSAISLPSKSSRLSRHRVCIRSSFKLQPDLPDRIVEASSCERPVTSCHVGECGKLGSSPPLLRCSCLHCCGVEPLRSKSRAANHRPRRAGVGDEVLAGRPVPRRRRPGAVRANMPFFWTRLACDT